MSEQYVAAASQNFTSPGLTALPPAFTVAVNVTTLPVETVVTAFPVDVTASVVVVAVDAHALWVVTPENRTAHASMKMTLLRPTEPGKRKVVEGRGPKSVLDMTGLAGVKTIVATAEATRNRSNAGRCERRSITPVSSWLRGGRYSAILVSV